MKKQNLTKLFMLLMLAMAVAAGCTKEGPQGPPGQDGQDGINGQDGTAGCVKCHDNSQTVEAKIAQWEASVHATGGNFERNAADCAPCHTSQGFLEVISTGNMETANAISNPLPPNCYTCHDIHDTYTEADWAFTYTDPVTFWLNGETTDQGKANLCVHCHQPRPVDPFPDVANPDANYEVTNSRFGPHHGPQGALIAGTGGYEVGTGYGTSPHSNIDNTCVHCHMAEAYGTQAGGHSMGVSYDYHGHTTLNMAACSDCHSDNIANTLEDVNTEIEGKLAQLRDLLEAEGIYNPETGLANTGTYTNRVAGAYYNYLFLEEDRSLGLHNYTYARALLDNSIASLSTLASK